MGQETQNNIYTPKLDSVLMSVFQTCHTQSGYCECDFIDSSDDDGVSEDNSDDD